MNAPPPSSKTIPLRRHLFFQFLALSLLPLILVIAMAAATGGPLHICHIGSKSVGAIDQVLAQRNGLAAGILGGAVRIVADDAVSGGDGSVNEGGLADLLAHTLTTKFEADTGFFPAVFEKETDDRSRTVSGPEHGEALRIERDDAGRVVRLVWGGYPVTRTPRSTALRPRN